MKRKLFVVLLAMVFAVSLVSVSEAGGRRHSTTVVQAQDDHNVAGVKLDAPNLVKIDKEGEWTLGVEGGKDIVKNIFYSDNDYLEADKGYFAYVKVTYNGCLLRCEEKVQE